MGDQWLNNCWLTYIEWELFALTDNDVIIKRFQMKTYWGQLQWNIIEIVMYYEDIIQLMVFFWIM